MEEGPPDPSMAGVLAEGNLVIFEGVDGAGFSDCRRSTRKSLRSPLARGRRAKSKSSPKSPLMRMAEMRKGGLRGSGLRQAGKKGLQPKEIKGLKGAGRMSERGLPPIPEFSVIGEGSLVCSGLEGFSGGEVGGESLGEDNAMVISGEGEVLPGAGSGEALPEAGGDEEGATGVNGACGVSGGLVLEIPVRGLEVGGSEFAGHPDVVLTGVQSDLALDLIAAQPLQEMGFVGKHNSPMLKKNIGEDCLMLESGVETAGEGVLSEGFPSLSKENLQAAKEKERSSKGKEIPRVAVHSVKENMSLNKEGSSSKVNGNSWSGTRNFKASLVNGVAGGNLPVSFEAENIRKMGVPGETCGLPSIQFSSAETSYLAEKLGFAIVGKFSHSIPSSLHIQRAFMGMKFKGEFSWKFINAKHVLVQFSLIDDYAKLLNGPNGMPVWFVDRHPMRVFKWTIDFDPFFESPIAAVWCQPDRAPHPFVREICFNCNWRAPR